MAQQLIPAAAAAKGIRDRIGARVLSGGLLDFGSAAGMIGRPPGSVINDSANSMDGTALDGSTIRGTRPPWAGQGSTNPYIVMPEANPSDDGSQGTHPLLRRVRPAVSPDPGFVPPIPDVMQWQILCHEAERYLDASLAGLMVPQFTDDDFDRATGGRRSIYSASASSLPERKSRERPTLPMMTEAAVDPVGWNYNAFFAEKIIMEAATDRQPYNPIESPDCPRSFWQNNFNFDGLVHDQGQVPVANSSVYGGSGAMASSARQSTMQAYIQSRSKHVLNNTHLFGRTAAYDYTLGIGSEPGSTLYAIIKRFKFERKARFRFPLSRSECVQDPMGSERTLTWVEDKPIYPFGMAFVACPKGETLPLEYLHYQLPEDANNPASPMVDFFDGVAVPLGMMFSRGRDPTYEARQQDVIDPAAIRPFMDNTLLTQRPFVDHFVKVPPLCI